MKFSTFLGRMQVMFQIYKQENEEFQESAKICFLLVEPMTSISRMEEDLGD
jgi:hypothetical protein